MILAKNTEIAKLENEGATLRSELVQLINTNTNLTATNENLNETITNLKADIDAGKAALSEDLTTVFEGIVDGLLAIEANIEELTTEITDLTDEVLSLEAMEEALNEFIATEAARLESINAFEGEYEALAPMTPEELELFDGLLSSSIEDAEIGFLHNTRAFFAANGSYSYVNFEISEDVHTGIFQNGAVQIIYRDIEGNIVANKRKHYADYLNRIDPTTQAVIETYGSNNPLLIKGTYQNFESKVQNVASIELRVTNNAGDTTRKFFFNNHLK